MTPVNCLDKTDEEIVLLTHEEEEYFACLIKRYEKRLLVYIKRLADLKIDEAEDILQETFIKTFYNLNDFDAGLKFSAWIYRIAHNETINFLRRNKIRATVFLTDEEWQKIAVDVDIKEKAGQKIDAEKIRNLLDKMEQKYQDVLVLKFLEGYDYKEISDILQKPMGTIATLIGRA
ncbi:MAG TPA: RNA polymerase sigma factor [bacterium]|nr:RNA polymerase sigma factor [bacterium]